jgi:hypothetical protein
VKETAYFEGKEYVVKYRHERTIGDDGYPKSHGGKTEAYIVLEYDKDGQPTSIISGIADCSKHDRFIKRMGRMIAKGRLLKRLNEGLCLM